MNRKVFITLTLALLTTSAVYSSTDEQTDVHRAALTKRLFKAKLIDLELYISGRLLKPWSQKMESVWLLKTTERGVSAHHAFN